MPWPQNENLEAKEVNKVWAHKKAVVDHSVSVQVPAMIRHLKPHFHSRVTLSQSWVRCPQAGVSAGALMDFCCASFLLHVATFPTISSACTEQAPRKSELCKKKKKKSRNRVNERQSARTNLGRYGTAVLSRPTTTRLLTASAAIVYGHVWCVPSFCLTPP